MVHLLDGALGTELIRRGVALPDEVGGAWSAAALASAPETIAEIHRAYANAGATHHTACTFRTQSGISSRWREELAEAIAICRGAVPAHHTVLASLAPIADCYRPDLSPAPDVTFSDFRAFAEEAERSGAQGILCETFANAREACAAVEASVTTGLPVWSSLSAGPDASLLTPADVTIAARELHGRGAAIVLVNCVDVTKMDAYVDALVASDVPFGVYANAGDRSSGIGWERATPAGVAKYGDIARSWIARGARVVGGCCGTSPAHIAAIRN